MMNYEVMHSSDISNVSAILLAEICQSPKIRSWTWPTNSEVASQAILFLGSQESMLEGHLMFATLTIVPAETGTLQLSGI